MLILRPISHSRRPGQVFQDTLSPNLLPIFQHCTMPPLSKTTRASSRNQPYYDLTELDSVLVSDPIVRPYPGPDGPNTTSFMMKWCPNASISAKQQYGRDRPEVIKAVYTASGLYDFVNTLPTDSSRYLLKRHAEILVEDTLNEAFSGARLGQSSHVQFSWIEPPRIEKSQWEMTQECEKRHAV